MVTSNFTVGLPLYVWPTTNAWTPVYNTIAANPNITFNVIVNPDSGPSAWPLDTGYASAVAKLNSYHNVVTYGYVHTSYTTRPIAQVKADIATYAKWSGNISMHGIFVDEAPATLAGLQYMENVYNSVLATMPKNETKVWTNPGTIVDSKFYKYANIVTAFEDTYAAWMNPLRTAIPSNLHANSCVMITTFSGTQKQIAAQASTLKSRGFWGGFLFGTEDYSASVPGSWEYFADSVQAA